MSLLGKTSKYDRHKLGTSGDPLGTPDMPGTIPSEGAYFAEAGSLNYTPFDSKGDHMKKLLISKIKSENSNVVYNPQENQPYGIQDLDGGGEGFSGQPANPTTGQFGGPYTSVGPTDGFY